MSFIREHKPLKRVVTPRLDLLKYSYYSVVGKSPLLTRHGLSREGYTIPESYPTHFTRTTVAMETSARLGLPPKPVTSLQEGWVVKRLASTELWASSEQ